ncbi:MAG: hypothetical protein GY938_16510, partial [Ketobacter sp.]|nr:hypothetical protein [Ketobacter sp.]
MMKLRVGMGSQMYKNMTYSPPRTVSERVNPCYASEPNNSVKYDYDEQSHTMTVPLDGISSLSTLYIGASVGLRWTSGGDVDDLAVGMIEVDGETGEPIASDTWPTYVGESLAQDNSDCDVVNTTDYDGCFTRLECNDFNFEV